MIDSDNRMAQHPTSATLPPGQDDTPLPSVEVSQSPEEKFREYLASRPRAQRFTEQQRDMVRYIFSKHNHFDADQLIDEMKREGFRVSRATIYRTLAKLVDAGLLRRLNIGTRTYYTTGIHDHHSVLSTFGAGPFVAGHTYFVLARIGTRVVPLGPGDADRVLFGMRAGIFDTLLTTPSFAQYLANRLEAAGERITSLAHVVTGGEPGGGIPAVRDHIESITGAFVNEVMGIGDIAPSLFGECPGRQGMHFSGGGHVWAEMVHPDSREPMTIEPGALGELAYTHLTREAHPVVRFLGGDLVEVQGGDCGCGRATFRMRIIGRRDDMFIVRGVNVYPSAILAVVGRFRPRVTGRARVVRDGTNVSVEPPVPIEVEVPDGAPADAGLKDEIEKAVRATLTFRCRVDLITESGFGEASYKTRLTRKT